jgi:hypothetical protein
VITVNRQFKGESGLEAHPPEAVAGTKRGLLDWSLPGGGADYSVCPDPRLSDDANVLSGGFGLDRLEGGGGGDDVMTGRRDSNTFVSKPRSGQDIITGLAVAQSNSAVGPDHDVRAFAKSVFADSAALFAHSVAPARGGHDDRYQDFVLI